MFSRGIRLGAATVAMCAAVSLLPTAARANSLHISATLYPAHTRISQLSPLSNQEMDCDWSFGCQNGQPIYGTWVFHLRSQDDLHRLSGWAQFGDTGSHTERMLFAVYASGYSSGDSDGLPWNVAAFSDFRAATLGSGYTDLDRVPQLVPKGMLGNVGAELLRSRSGDVIAMACWVGSVEVEGIAVYVHGMPLQRRIALSSLARQIRSAVVAELGSE